MMKFSDIILDQNECPIFIRVEHFKLNRIRNIQDEEGKDYLMIPVTKELRDLLMEMGYHEFKGTDTFLIAPTEGIKRSVIMDLISRSFSHFYRLLKTGRALQFKCLRKTYITQLFMKFGDDTKILTHHSGMEVIKKHYLDTKPLLESVKDFSVFD